MKEYLSAGGRALVLFAAAVAMFPITALTTPAAAHALTDMRELSFEDRVACQRAIEAEYWRQRTWPAENAGPKPALSTLISQDALRAKTEDILLKSNALATIWKRPLTASQLQAEIAHMARETRRPEMLRALWKALETDPKLIAECLARPLLVDRLVRNWYAFDSRFHAAARARADADLAHHATTDDMRSMSGHYREQLWRRGTIVDRDAIAMGGTAEARTVGETEWAALIAELSEVFGLTGTSRSGDADALPSGALSPLREDANRYYLIAILDRRPDSLRVATVEWPKMPFDAWWSETKSTLSPTVTPVEEIAALPEIGEDCVDDTWRSTPVVPRARAGHVAVWTGSEMLIWGGNSFFSDSVAGGRYDPALDAWYPLSLIDAPIGRSSATAVWTGTEMIVWGGNGLSDALDTGGRYNPSTDSWRPTSTGAGAAIARTDHTAVWTGSEMIVWGGCTGGLGCATFLTTGGRYDPVSDSWTSTSTMNTPQARHLHSAIWTGSEMVVWGGEGAGVNIFGDGGRYDPATDSWSPMSTQNAPEARVLHEAVWTGSDMVVFGGCRGPSCPNPQIESGGGARYHVDTDTWSLTNPVGAPGARYAHAAVWSGTEVIVQGGCLDNECSFQTSTGGRYDPTSDTWTATETDGAPSRAGHVGVWSGTEMIVWGGCIGGECQNSVASGGRYDPVMDSWLPTTLETAPSGRINHSAVWTGAEMILWGGAGASNDGSRYDPATDHWTPVNPFGARGRERHTAVWTGTEMLVWGGSQEGVGGSNTGERYNVVTDSWTQMSTLGAPQARQNQSAVWTGSEMIIWGGCPGNVCLTPYLNTGGRYTPATDTWTSMSTVNAPSGRIATGAATEPLAVWTGTEMIVWGGWPTNAGQTRTGGRYSPATDSWTATNLSGSPSARRHHTLEWTGTEMLVWGGEDGGGSLGNGARYDPASDSWTLMSNLGAPLPRHRHSAVWTGTEMIVWGGTDPLVFGGDHQTGGRYDPGSNRWTATSTGAFVPFARNLQTAVWTGDEMIVWGGSWFGSGQSDTGGRYCAAPAVGGDPELSVTGTCPGIISIDVAGVTPNGRVALLWAAAEGLTPVPGGACQGTELGLANPRRLALVTGDANGNFSASPTLPAGACGRFMQALDLTACAVSNVAQLP